MEFLLRNYGVLFSLRRIFDEEAPFLEG